MMAKSDMRSRRWQVVLVAGTIAIGLTVDGTDAALIPSISGELRGRPLPSFESHTLDGQPFSSRDLVGKPVIVNFFASWCPVCSMELKDLQTLQPDLRQHGVSVIEVLVDPVETPDTVDEAREQLARNPLPFPVVMMMPALRDVFAYEGFPATYFVKADGTFSTTLFGYQPIEQLRQVAWEIAGQGAETTIAPPSSPVPSGGVGRHPPWEKRPLLALVPAPWAQWHPLLVHFPIALLVLEAAFVCALLVRPSERLAQFSTWLLGAAVASLVPTIRLARSADASVPSGELRLAPRPVRACSDAHRGWAPRLAPPRERPDPARRAADGLHPGHAARSLGSFRWRPGRGRHLAPMTRTIGRKGETS
ncbi:MAG: redoxin domain-containing protein [Deltaproteobacteria bacterium]|nr:MAG: redoxin domain-containing protein [Deltaproteobacteria bacterium]